MDLKGLEGYQAALEAYRKNVSPRFLHLSTFDDWVHGRQYQGLPNWFDESKPLWERAPCVVYLLTKESIEAKIDLTLGEGRFPDVTASPGEDDEAFDDAQGLNKEDSGTLDRFIKSALKQCKFESLAREVLDHGQDVGSAVVIFGIRNGKLFADTTKAQWAEPTLDVEGNCSRLEIRYPYLDPYKDAFGKWKVRAKIYRRVIDDKTDQTYLPADADREGAEPQWIADPKQKFTHGFGFCPVRWYPFMKGCGAVNQVDGHPVHELALDEIRALDFTLSQRHRAVLFAGDPQIVETGVTPGYNPTESVRGGRIPSTELNADGSPVNSWNDAPPQAARKKSPGVVWQYPNVDTKVEYLTLDPGVVEALTNHANDFRMKLCDMLAHVPLDPDAVAAVRALSGKALQALRQRELSRCDKIRDDFGDRFLLPAVNMLMRICATFEPLGGLKLAGLDKVAGILPKFLKGDVSLKLIWGDYDTPDATEEGLVVATTAAAHTAGLITDLQGITKIADIFDIEDPAAALVALQEEKAKRQADTIATAQALKPPPGKEGDAAPKDSKPANPVAVPAT